MIFFDEEDAEVLRLDNFDDAVECCADLGIPFFLDAGNKKLVFWFVRVDDEGYPEIGEHEKLMDIIFVEPEETDQTV